MTDLFRSLAHFQQRLAAAGIDSVVIGGIAVSVWAKPRTTLDVDLKIWLHRDQAQQLLDLLPPDYTPLQDHPLQTLQRHGILFIKDMTGIRIDVQLADVSFDEAAIQRARHRARVRCHGADLHCRRLDRLQNHFDTVAGPRRCGEHHPTSRRCFG